ncbi:hypothetical protein CR983_01910 [Candidatus Saccharibacteria bacterium]|nr:MAG: hypothetical protein CR983_01910 [Candidatus Saccharibacteria bacterium]
MADLNESTIKQAVQQELQTVRSDVGQVKSQLAQLERRLQEISSVHDDTRRMIAQIERLLSQTREVSATQTLMSHISGAVDELRARLQSIERCSAASAIYAEKRLRERTERGYV